MASAWGDSWGTNWGISWDAVIVQVIEPFRFVSIHGVFSDVSDILPGINAQYSRSTDGTVVGVPLNVRQLTDQGVLVKDAE